MKWKIQGFAFLIASITANPIQQHILSLNDELDTVRAELIKADIIPDVISDFQPKYRLSVLWPSNKTATLGNAISPDDVQDEPAVDVRTLTDNDVSVLNEALISPDSHAPTVTVVMTDPDAPSREDPKWAQFCHWIVKDVPITQPVKDSGSRFYVSSQKDVMPYKPPSPPKKTSFHRYVFLAFEAKNGTKSELDISKPSDRKRWGTGKKRHGVADWAKENELVPVAANFIYVQNEKQ